MDNLKEMLIEYLKDMTERGDEKAKLLLSLVEDEYND
mgnify:CR=1 FL=1